MAIGSMAEAKLKLYQVSARMKNYEIDMGPNGSLKPMSGAAAEVDEVLQWLEQIYR